MKSLFFTTISVLLLLTFTTQSSQAQCSSCTYTITSNSNQNYNLNNGQTLCISTGVNFTGNINVNGGTLCNSGNITGNVNFNSGKIYNYGKFTQNGAFSLGGEMHNYAQMSVANNININSGGKLYNEANATLNIGGHLSNNNVFYNYGASTIGGNYSANGGSTNENYGTVTLTNGNLNINAPLLNEGTLDVKGYLHVNGGGSLTVGINDVVKVGGNYENNSTTTNHGYINVSGNFTNNGGAIFTDNLSMIVMGNFTNNGTINGDAVGCNTFSVFGGSIVQNGGSSMTSIDFCGNGVPGNFTTNYGTVNNNVTFCSCTSGGVTPLPIILKSFTATCNENAVDVEWITETEINNAFFTVSRSQDAVNWETVHVEQGAGNSNAELSYAFQDGRPLSGISYYKLQQTDLDGTTKYFTPISVSCDAASHTTSVSVFPNPADEQWTVSIQTAQSDNEASMEMIDFTGRKVLSKLLALSAGQSSVTLDRNGMTSGTYLIRVISNGQVLGTQKVILR